jgi:hypothetical protein
MRHGLGGPRRTGKDCPMNDQKKNALRVATLGFACSAVAFTANALWGDASPRIAHMFALGIVFGNAICFVGSIQLARAKGRSWAVGLLGLLNVVGLAILWFAVRDARPART